MISFGKFSEQYIKKYIALYFDSDTEDALRKYCTTNGFDLTKDYDGADIEPEEFKFHTTVFFTSNAVRLTNGRFKIKPFEMTGYGLEIFGKDNDIPVLKINPHNDELQQVRKRFERLGLRDFWPEYKPHVSLSYNFKGKSVSGIPMPDFPIRVTEMVIKDQSSDK